MKYSNKIKSVLTTFSAIIIFAVAIVAQTGEASLKLISLSVDDHTAQVNVMGEEMPLLPDFPVLSKKAGFVRRYVKDTLRGKVAAKNGRRAARNETEVVHRISLRQSAGGGDQQRRA